MGAHGLDWGRYVLLWPLHWLMAARGQLFAFVPVFIGAGVGLWFALPWEPLALHYSAALALGLLMLAAMLRGPDLGRPIFVAALCACAGFGAAGLRAHTVAAPMLEFRFYGPVQGRVIEVDRSQSDALRITLDNVVLGDVAPAKTPRHVRISLQGAADAPQAGQVVMVTAHLAAPDGPTEPGAFDFRRTAFFDGLGAVGYTRSPVMLWADADADAQLIARLRAYLTRTMLDHMPSQAGAFAAGAMTGDRAAITQDTVQALRDSNLAHLLAISGMNLAFISGFVFFLIRYGVALAPPVALRVNAKKIAAVVALAVALFYLALSGANVSTTRAFLMICVMLGAVLLDRRAISMRSVAFAAIILLLVTPESLLDPGFQLSFSATVVLVGAYGALDRGIMRGRVPRWIMPLFALVLTSVLAGAATAPFAAAHFNRFTDYGLLANLLTVPVMSILMAAGVLAALLAPFGAAAPALWVMEQCGAWILAVAHWVAGLDGAVTPIVAPSPAVLPLISLGGLWLLVWQGRRRLLALPVLALALALWATSPRPDVLISSDGRLAGVMGQAGRALSHEKGAGFSAKTWLEDDGDLALQPEGAARAGFAGPKEARAFSLGPFAAVMLSGKGVAGAFAQACRHYDIVILPAAFDPAELGAAPRTGCTVIDRAVLDKTGALAGQVLIDKLVLRPTRSTTRIWSDKRPILPAIIVAAPKLAAPNADASAALAP